MEILDMRDRISSINVELLVDESINQTKSSLEELIRNQILHGKDGAGNYFPNYSSHPLSVEYVKMKHSLGRFPYDTGNVYNLWNEGDYLNALHVNIDGNSIVIDSSDGKAQIIEELIGDSQDVYLPDDNSSEIYADILLQDFTNNMRILLDLM